MMAFLVRAAALVCALSAGTALAATISCGESCPSGWQAFPESLSSDGATYWDNQSLDTLLYDSLHRPKAVGHFLTEGSATGYATAKTIAPDQLEWFGQASGAGPNNFYFDRGATPTVRFNLLLHDTGNALAFGYYDVQTGQRTVLFDTTSPVGATRDVQLPAQFGFFMTYLEGTWWEWYDTGSVYKSQSTLSDTPEGHSAEDTHQHFVAFRQADGSPDGYTYYLGVEDLYLGATPGSWASCNPEGFGDFNDFIVQLQAIHAPEPGAFGLAVLGLAGIAFGAIRRRLRP
jgi:hypothetical protein